MNIRRALAVAFVSLMMGLGGGTSALFASAPPDTVPSDTSTTDTSPPDTVNDFMDLERDVTECISSNPLPGCGREPTGPGDRGGWQQLLLFGVMLGGMAVIFVRVYFSVRSRDRGASNE